MDPLQKKPGNCQLICEIASKVFRQCDVPQLLGEKLGELARFCSTIILVDWRAAAHSTETCPNRHGHHSELEGVVEEFPNEFQYDLIYSHAPKNKY